MAIRYPLYVISKGRWESRLTVKALIKCKVPFKVVIEPQEYDQYTAVIEPDSILVLPFSNLGQGSIPARNWVWEHSIGLGAERHWILDDNIRGFQRREKSLRIQVHNDVPFRVIEDIADRYTNIALAGMQCKMFEAPVLKHPRSLIMNTRVYSNILIDNALPFRWRGRYNEDTDLSLRALKAGYCTFLTRSFLADKMATMLMKGGNTDQLYVGNGRLLMAQSLQQQHPDVCRIARKWGRWQHHVNYEPFRFNKPILREGVTLPTGTDEYGLTLVRIDSGAIPTPTRNYAPTTGNYGPVLRHMEVVH